MSIRETLPSFPSLAAIHLNTPPDYSYELKAANIKKEFKAELRQHGNRHMRLFLEECNGIHLDQLAEDDRAIQVHVSIPTSFYDGVNETDYYFVSYTFKTQSPSPIYINRLSPHTIVKRDPGHSKIWATTPAGYVLGMTEDWP